jgi:N12 class adenine-specific DNA methylase
VGAGRFRPGAQADLAPAGVRAKLTANLAALRVLHACRDGGRSASGEEQAVLARWSGWGAIPQVFDERDDRYLTERAELRELLGSEAAWAAARRTTINAHYTSAPVVDAMWQTVGRLGLPDEARGLEPGCGSGNFLGFAPPGVSMVGVELDPTTAGIARLLYATDPSTVVHNVGFEEYVDDAGFDVAIGNVPFASVVPFDPVFNRQRHSLHNYFLVKALHLVRPGGFAVALTSRYTMDARNPAARSELAGLADLVGAVRLPERAFAASSGTDVVVDLLVLRRREPDREPRALEWLRTTTVDVAGATDRDSSGQVEINAYFDTHPGHLLGRLAVGRGMYGDGEQTVLPDGPLEPALASALDDIVTQALDADRGFTARPASMTAPARVTVSAGSGFETGFAQVGSFVVSPAKIGRYRPAGGIEAFEPRFAKDIPELRRLVELRDAARSVLAVQVDGGDDTALEAAQVTLGARYDDYTRIYGPLNRSTLARGRAKEDGEAEVVRRMRPRMGGFRAEDPDWPLVAALEVFDEETQTATKAAIFTQRVVDPPVVRLGVDAPAEAVAVCLDESGTVTTARVAELLGLDEAAARTQLDGLVYDDPATNALVPAAEYLSGNVRRKIDACRALLDERPELAANVEALEAVIPRQLDPADISARLGAPWIPASDIEAFCSEEIDARVDVEHLAGIGHWTLKVRYGRGSVAATSVWGTARADALTLVDAALNQRLHTVYDTDDDGKRTRNDVATLAARDKQERLTERFSKWVWEDPERAERLARRYNELFSSTVLPAHDGSHLTLPGLATSFTPRQHQRDAVARILTDGRALLAHAVGAGKTATMVMAAMEGRRLGSMTKPAVVVPNHMLEQFSREWLQLYPTARILVADREKLSKERRKEFVARCATGDWDGVIFTQSGFTRIDLGRDLKSEYLRQELDEARAALDTSQSGKGLTVKRMEKRIAQLEETYRKLLTDRVKDDGVRFEETGIDYLFADEAHAYKNRRIITSIDGVANTGSRRSQDLAAKLWVLRQRHGPRVVTFATATPVANSMAELWVMQSYLHPDLLGEVDLRVFDAWAATFGRTHTALELAPDGSSYRMQTRFARFQNVPELLLLYRQVADVRTSDDLKLPTPEIIGGKARTVVVEPTDELVDYVALLAERAEKVRNRAVLPTEDNMLKVTGDGRRAALDLRLVDPATPPDAMAEAKVAVAARHIARIHHDTHTNTYHDAFGQPSLRPGGLQLVFCDVSTPAGTGWNAYDELRHHLIRHGVPAETIRYMQDAKTDTAKAALFAACRDGSVAVLVGSTETMGVGTNVQDRAVALHHLDAPWRPADIEQRDGRILRQGNQNRHVHVIRYVTQGSFDTYMWQTLERKAAFISQVSRGDLPSRDIDDIGDQALTFAEVKALATGDPLVLEKAGVDSDVARLTRLERAHLDDQHALRKTRDGALARAERAWDKAEQLTPLLDRLQDTHGDRFTMIINSQVHTKRVDAGTHLKRTLTDQLATTPPDTASPPTPIGALGGLPVTANVTRVIADEIRLTVPDTTIDLTYAPNEWTQSDPAIIVTRLEHRLQRLPTTHERLLTDHKTALTEADTADARIGQPFDHAQQLAALRRRQQEINEHLNRTTNAQPPDPQPPTPAAAAGPPDWPAQPTTTATATANAATTGVATPTSSSSAADGGPDAPDRGLTEGGLGPAPSPRHPPELAARIARTRQRLAALDRPRTRPDHGLQL